MLIWGIRTQDIHNILYKLSATWTDIFPLTPGWQMSWFRWSDSAVLLFNMLYTSGNVTRSILQKANQEHLPSERIRIRGLKQRKKTEKGWYYEYFSYRWQGLSCNLRTWKPKTATTFYTKNHFFISFMHHSWLAMIECVWGLKVAMNEIGERMKGGLNSEWRCVLTNFRVAIAYKIKAKTHKVALSGTKWDENMSMSVQKVSMWATIKA